MHHHHQATHTEVTSNVCVACQYLIWENLHFFLKHKLTSPRLNTASSPKFPSEMSICAVGPIICLKTNAYIESLDRNKVCTYYSGELLKSDREIPLLLVLTKTEKHHQADTKTSP